MAFSDAFNASLVILVMSFTSSARLLHNSTKKLVREKTFFLQLCLINACSVHLIRLNYTQPINAMVCLVPAEPKEKG